MKIEIGKFYLVGPWNGGLYSREKVIRDLGDGNFVTQIGTNQHLHRHHKDLFIRETNRDMSKFWYIKEELGL